MKNIAINAIDSLRSATENGCRFMTFIYASKGTGGVGKYQINFGISNESACKADKTLLEAYQPQDETETLALNEMIQSINETLTKGVSDSYTQVDTFVPIGKGIKQHKETGEIYISGLVESYEEIEAPITPKKKPLNSSAKTLAKEKIRKELELKRNRFRSFILSPDNIGGIRVCGEVIELHP